MNSAANDRAGSRAPASPYCVRRGAASYEDEGREGSDVAAYVPAMPRVSGW